MDYYKAFPFYMGYRDMPYNDMSYNAVSGNAISNSGTQNNAMPNNGMPYQGYGQWGAQSAQQPMMMLPEDRILEDMEYLQQMYPTYAKNYQGVISSVVDKMDYNGSFIYDQYPDKLSIQRMVLSVMTVIKANEDKENKGSEMRQRQEMEPRMQADTDNRSTGAIVTADTLTERAPWGEKEPWIKELVTVLMYYEILARRKRRQKKYWGMSI